MSPFKQRLIKVLSEIDEIVKEIGPKMIRLGHLRNEALSLIEDLKKDDQGDGQVPTA